MFQISYRIFALIFFVVSWSSAFSRAALADSPKYLGVGSCASSQCHGQVQGAAQGSILKNEFTTWYHFDKHAKSYASLLGADAKKMGEHLGIAAPEKEKLCLDCHATNVPEGLRGQKFRISDGVSCESCHGASEEWIQRHTENGATHASNVSHGMKEILPLAARANLCISCHAGDSTKEVTHRLIGAGHPRLSFELDTFEAVMPRHWKTDESYEKRKERYSPIAAWLAGQTALANRQLETLKAAHDELNPELSQFYCYSCHHSLASKQWKRRSYGGAPGELRVNTAHLDMLAAALATVNEPAATQLSIALASLGHAASLEEWKKSLDDISEKVGSARAQLSSQPLAPQKLGQQLMKYSAQRDQLAYQAAEQVAMALSAIQAQDKSALPISSKALQAMYDDLKNESKYSEK